MKNMERTLLPLENGAILLQTEPFSQKYRLQVKILLIYFINNLIVDSQTKCTEKTDVGLTEFKLTTICRGKKNKDTAVKVTKCPVDLKYATLGCLSYNFLSFWGWPKFASGK